VKPNAVCCCPLQHNELLALVSQQEAARGGEAGKINWTQVGMLLGRDPSDAVKEYKALRATTVRHGVFTSEEDNVIIQRFVEWQQCHPDKPGLWVALAKELNRMDKRISERWRHVLQKRLNVVDGQIDLSNMYRDAGRGRRADSHIATSPGSDAAQDSEGSMRLLETGAAQTLQELSRRAQRKRTIDELKAEHKVLYSGVKRWTQSMVSRTLYWCCRLLRRAAARLAISPLCFSSVSDGDPLCRFRSLQDERLREAVALYPRDWLRIALHVGVEADSSKCRKRWARVREKYRKEIEGEAGVPKQDSFQFDLVDKEGDEEFADLGEEEVDGLDIDGYSEGDGGAHGI
jgi:hypothetical protein